MIAAEPPPKPSLAAPARARIGHAVRVVATGVTTGRYSLTIVYDKPPAHNARCLADVGRPAVAREGTVTLRGTIPHRLTCYQGANVKLGAVPTGPGAYHFVVGQKLAPNGWQADASFLRRRVRITR